MECVYGDGGRREAEKKLNAKKTAREKRKKESVSGRTYKGRAQMREKQ